MSLQSKTIKFDEKAKDKIPLLFPEAKKCSQKWVACIIHRK